MKSFVALSFCLVLFLAVSCNKPRDNNYYRDFSTAISVSDLFSEYAFKDYVATEEQKIWAEEYLQKAILLKEESPQKALYLAKRALSLSPSQDGYLLVADLMLKCGKNIEASEAWAFIVNKYCDKIDNVIYINYLYSLISSSKAKIYTYIPLLETCDNNSVSFAQKQDLKNLILKDPRFKEFENIESYKEVMCMLDYNQEEREEMAKNPALVPFDSFLVQFPIKLPNISIGINELQNFNYNNLNNYFDEGPGSFCDSRLMDFTQYYPTDKNLGWRRTNNWGQIKIYDTFKTLIFAYDTSGKGTTGNMRCTDYAIVNYNNKGEIIAQKLLAVHAGEKLTTATINDSVIVLSNYERNWKEPFKNHIIDNEVISTNLLNTETIIIDTEGHFKTLNPE